MNTLNLPMAISCHVLMRIPTPREVRKRVQYLLQICMCVMSGELQYNQHCS